MGDLPLPASSGAGALRFSVTPVTSDRTPAKSSQASRDLALLSVLREAVTAGRLSTDSILNALADAARVLSGADGTAIASRKDGVIVCRARSGGIAPGLGAPLNSDSGISGECLRKGAIQICSDAATDERVDSEACRSLGIRSVAVVPLRGSTGMFGILEAFSAHTDAFEKEQIDSLRALAEIAELAYGHERRLPATASVTPATRRPELLAPAAGMDQDHAEQRSSTKRYWIVGVVAVVLVMMALAAQMSWRQTGAEIAASASSPQPASNKAASNDRPKVVAAPKPDAAIAVGPLSARQANRARTRNLIENAAEIRPESETSGPLTPNKNSSFTDASARSTKPAAISESDPPPPIAVTSPRNEMPQLASQATPMPRFGAPISQGVVEPTLIRRVVPSYPSQARLRGTAGSVVLDATIAEDGSVPKVTVVSGPATLTDAAASAVRQWRYNPALLNGKPVLIQRRITVVFKLP